jgi:hypothetical protein
VKDHNQFLGHQQQGGSLSASEESNQWHASKAHHSHACSKTCVMAEAVEEAVEQSARLQLRQRVSHRHGSLLAVSKHDAWPSISVGSVCKQQAAFSTASLGAGAVERRLGVTARKHAHARACLCWRFVLHQLCE